MSDKNNTTFILYVAGITIMIIGALIGIKTYHAFNGILQENTRIFYCVCISSIGLVIGTLFIALAELVSNVKQINHRLGILTYEHCEEIIIRRRKEG